MGTDQPKGTVPDPQEPTRAESPPGQVDPPGAQPAKPARTFSAESKACILHAADNDSLYPVASKEFSLKSGNFPCNDFAWFNYGSYLSLKQYLQDGERKRLFACICFHDNAAAMSSFGVPRDGYGNYVPGLSGDAVNGSGIGWNYYGGRNQGRPCVGSRAAWKYGGEKLTDNYIFPERTSSQPTSKTLATCEAWVTGSSGWNGKLPHMVPDDSFISNRYGDYMWAFPNFECMNVSYTDGGAAWVKLERMGAFKDVNYMYFDLYR